MGAGAVGFDVHAGISGTDDPSSALTLDFLKDNVMKDMSEKKQVRTMRVLIVFFIVVSVVIAFRSADLLSPS